MKAPNPRATLRFDRRIRLEFHGATITSDAGLLACRELDDALGLTETANECLQESRGGRNVQHKLVGLLRQSVYSRLAGYEDTNDAERLADDPTMRVVVGDRGIDRPAASASAMSRFETEVLTQDSNVAGLGRLNAKWVDGAIPSSAVSAQGGQALVAAERAGQADQDGRPSGAARAAIDLSVVRGVGSSTVVPGRAGSNRPVIAGAKLREGYNHDFAKRGRALQGVALSSMRFHHTGRDTKTTKTDKKHGSRQESHPLLDRPEIDWPCRT